METNKILVTLIDPQPLFREGVKTILQSTNEIEVIEQLDSLRNITKKESMHILLIHVSEFMQERYELSQTYIGRNSNVKVDRKSTRLNSSHVSISYVVIFLKKKIE